MTSPSGPSVQSPRRHKQRDAAIVLAQTGLTFGIVSLATMLLSSQIKACREEATTQGKVLRDRLSSLENDQILDIAKGEVRA